MKKVLVPKRLHIQSISWKNSDGGVQKRYQAHIWQPTLKKYARFVLKDDSGGHIESEMAAIDKAISLYADYKKNVDEGHDISVRRKSVPFLLDEFIKFKKRQVGRKLTDRRVVVLEHLMKSFVRHWEETGKREIDDYTKNVYELSFMDWRVQQPRQGNRWKSTDKPYTNRFLNNELRAHKQFINFLVQRGFATHRIELEDLKTERVNNPFPEKNYPKLQSVIRKDIEHGYNVRTRWSAVNYYYVILLMNRLGIRVAEAKNFMWEDIQKDGDDTRVRFWGKDKERRIKIPPSVADQIENMRVAKQKLGASWDWNEDDYPYVFGQWKDATKNTHWDNKLRTRWMRESGVDPSEFQYVSFRHKFITDALNEGVNSLEIALFCGTSQRMIEQTYGHLVADKVYDLVFKNVPDDVEKGKGKLPVFIDRMSGG
jgi:integrase